ncbi:MAG: hypothetical protein IJD33_02565, partial [Clostridia bacterium]|nr:hypothetical protein [Clostridia bacterium]
MKKTVIIAIGIIYLASILIVNFFGLEMIGFESNQYVSSIEVTGIVVDRDEKTEVRQQQEEDGTVWYRFLFVEGGENTVLIEYTVAPDNASNKKLDFVYDYESMDGKVVVSAEENKLEFLTST